MFVRRSGETGSLYVISSSVMGHQFILPIHHKLEFLLLLLDKHLLVKLLVFLMVVQVFEHLY